jgi:hypothetical protein
MPFRQMLSLVVLGLVLGAPGCSSKDKNQVATDDGSANDKKKVEQSSNKGKIEGTKWSSEAGSINGRAQAPGAFRLEFGKDGSLVGQMPAGPFKGTYSLEEGDWVKVELKETRMLGKNPSGQVTIDGDKLTLKCGETRIVFDRVK